MPKSTVLSRRGEWTHLLLYKYSLRFGFEPGPKNLHLSNTPCLFASAEKGVFNLPKGEANTPIGWKSFRNGFAIDVLIWPGPMIVGISGSVKLAKPVAKKPSEGKSTTKKPAVKKVSSTKKATTTTKKAPAPKKSASTTTKSTTTKVSQHFKKSVISIVWHIELEVCKAHKICFQAKPTTAEKKKVAAAKKRQATAKKPAAAKKTAPAKKATTKKAATTKATPAVKKTTTMKKAAPAKRTSKK